MSMLRNCPVISNERQIGLLQSIGLDAAQNGVRVLIVAGGFRGKQIVYADQVLALTPQFILVGESEKYRRGCESLCMRFARDSTGLLVGKVTDCMIDEKTMRAAAFEIVGGYLMRERKLRIWVFSWSVSKMQEDELIIPNVFFGEPHEKSEEA